MMQFSILTKSGKNCVEINLGFNRLYFFYRLWLAVIPQPLRQSAERVFTHVIVHLPSLTLQPFRQPAERLFTYAIVYLHSYLSLQATSGATVYVRNCLPSLIPQPSGNQRSDCLHTQLYTFTHTSAFKQPAERLFTYAIVYVHS